LALLASTLIVPLSSKGKDQSDSDPSNDKELETLLLADGTVVQAPKSVVKQSKVLNKKVSNRKLLKWLKNTKTPKS
jgi:hypothetical protein